MPVKTMDAPQKAKNDPDEKPTSSKRQPGANAKVQDGANVDKKPKTDHGKQVHSPVSSSKLNLNVQADKSSGTTSSKKGDSPPTKREEENFETGIGDDSNAPNPTAPTGGKVMGKTTTVSPEMAIVSPRQTRSRAKKATNKREDVSPPRTRKRKHSISKVESEEDEIQVISSPESSRPKKKTSATAHKSSLSNASIIETKVNMSEPRERKAKGATTQGGTGEEGLESTVCVAFAEKLRPLADRLIPDGHYSIRRAWMDSSSMRTSRWMTALADVWPVCFIWVVLEQCDVACSESSALSMTLSRSGCEKAVVT